MARPVGPVKIEATEMASRDVLRARLSGPISGEVAAVRHGRKFYFTAPGIVDGPKEVPADSLVDCLHESVMWVEDWAKEAKKSKRKK